MDRITRYIVAELLKTFLLSLFVMTTFLEMIFLVQEAWRENLTPETILLLIPFTIPTALCFAIPGTILFSACIVYGRMSASNEIVAMKAMGIAPTRAIWPGLVLATILSLLTVYLNDVSVSWGKHGIYKIVLNSSAKTIYSILETQGSFHKGKISIVVDEVRDGVLINPHIETSGEDSSRRRRIQAQEARIHVDTENNKLVFQLKNGRVDYADDVTFNIDEKNINIELGDFTKKSDTSTSPSNLPLRRMRGELVAQRAVVERKQQELALQATMQLLGGNMVALTHPVWRANLHSLDKAVIRGHRLRTEPWRRWANGFSCFCFVLVGAGVAISFKRFDFWSIFAVCFVPILLVYYPLLMFGVGKAKAGELPPFSVWIGNVVILLVGLILIRKIEKS